MSIKQKNIVNYFNRLIKQFITFLSFSGIGFIIDLFVYTVLTMVFDVKVSYANFMSALPAITFVYVFSIKYVFKVIENKKQLLITYFMYICYQLILLLCVSCLSQILYEYLVEWKIFTINTVKLCVKLLITPITISCNFFVLRNIVKR